MNNFEQKFWKTVTWFGELPGILIPLGLIGLVFVKSMYYSGPMIIESIKDTQSLQIVNNTILQALLLGFGGVFCSFSIGTVIKYLYYKPRPIPPDTSTLWKRINAGSMPSIHSSNALITAFALFQCYMYFYDDNSDNQIILIAIILFFYYLSIALSRIALQKHYPIDVLAGTGLGVLIIFTLIISMDDIIHFIGKLLSNFLNF